MTKDQVNLTNELWQLHQSTPKKQGRKRSKIRRLISEISIENFISLYFSDEFSYTSDELNSMGLWHYGIDIEEYADQLLFNPSSYEAFKIFDQIVHTKHPVNYCMVKPRGFGKSTEIKMLVLYAIAMQSHKYILYISNNANLSDKMLDNLKKAVIASPLLQRDYPEFQPKRHFHRNMFENFSRKLVAYQHTYVEGGYSNKVAIRGVNIGGLRPDLVVIDDIDSLEDCQSPKKRQDLEHWFEQDIMRLGGNINPSICVVGTIFHDDSLISKVAIKQKYSSFENNIKIFPAISADGVSLWPEIWPIGRLELEKKNLGSFAFASEFMCDPVPSDQVMFNIEDIKRNAFRMSDLPGQLDSHKLVCFIDIATGIKASNDYTAITVVYQDDDGLFYVVDSILFRKSLHQLKEFILDHHSRWNYRKLGIEENNREDFIKDMRDSFRRNKIMNVLVKGIRHTTNKVLRIETHLQSLIESGGLRFTDDYDKRYPVLIEQLVRFPVGSHDDGPDSLSGCIEMFGTRRIAQAINTVGYQTKRDIENQKQREEYMHGEKLYQLAKDKKLQWQDAKKSDDHPKTVRMIAYHETDMIQYLYRHEDAKEIASYFRDGIWNFFRVDKKAEFYKQIRESINGKYPVYENKDGNADSNNEVDKSFDIQTDEPVEQTNNRVGTNKTVSRKPGRPKKK